VCPLGNELADARVFAVETGGRLCYSDLQYQPGDAFVFGPETRGLPTSVQKRIGQQSSLFLPMMPANRSINLSNAVAIVGIAVIVASGLYIVGRERNRARIPSNRAQAAEIPRPAASG